MINIKEIIRQLAGNAETIQVLVQAISDEQAQWQPNPETWSMIKVMGTSTTKSGLTFAST